MRIGIIYCAYNCSEYLNKSLTPFINLKQKGVISYISAVSVPFLEYKEINTKIDNTTELLKYDFINHLDILFTEPKFIDESTARNLCLQFLIDHNVDLIWMVDGDEFYSEKDIVNIIKYIEDNPDFFWYKINFKNYIFDGKRWIDGFCPPRIFRTHSNILNIYKFYWDNDILYQVTDEKEKFISYKDLTNSEIPRDIAHVKHMTWLHKNGKSKYEYQMNHFGSCGYKWNEEKNELEFNYDFYIKNSQSIPQIYLDS